MQYDQFHEEHEIHQRVQQSQISNMNMNSFDILVVDEADHQFWTSKRNYQFKCILRKIVVMLFNGGPVYFSYLVVSLYIFKLLQTIDTKKEIKTMYMRQFIYDYCLCICICLVYGIFIYGFVNFHRKIYQPYFIELDQLFKEFFHWSCNCILFIILYTVFITQKELHKMEDSEIEKSFQISNVGKNKNQTYIFSFSISYLFSQQNYSNIGLGRSNNTYIQSQEQQSNNNQIVQHIQHFSKQIENIIDQQNLDPTLIYFSMSQDFLQASDETKPSPMKKKKTKMLAHTEARTVLDYLSDLGFNGKRSIFTHFLLPHYVYTRKFEIPDKKVQIVVVIMLIMVKIILPLIFIFRPIEAIGVLLSLIFMGFYLHFLAIVLDLVLNDDLKTKNYIIQALNNIIDIQMEGQSDLEHRFQNLIDITCSLSLQSWNLMRNVTIYIEKKKKIEYNYIYAFIALYGVMCFVSFILCRFNLPFLQAINYCDDQVLLYNIHADIVLTFILCMVRIFQGSKFNDSFIIMDDNIHRLTAIYEDLYTLFDYYFADGMEDQIENQIYKEVIKLIKIYAIKQLTSSDNRRKNKSDAIETEKMMIMREKVQEIRGCLLKIQKQVEKDVTKCNDKFIGLIQANFKKQLRIFGFVLVTFFPDLFDKVWRYVSKMM